MAQAASSTDPAAALKRARALRVQLARRDPRVFAEYVLRDEHDGKSIRLAPMHERWHRLMDANPRLVLHAHFEAGKSAAISIGRVLYELGRDPTMRVCILSNTHGQACKIIRTIADYIERSPELAEVFPSLRRGSGIWRDDALTVQRPTMAKDASVVATGLHGAILGSRFDLVVIDDLLDFESTRTEQQRQITWDWISSTVLTRLTDRARVVAVGTAWHRDDALHRLARSGWAHERFGVLDDAGNPHWPERWPVARIEQTRAALGPFESARQLDCVPRSDEQSVFQAEWIEAAIARGVGLTPAASFTQRVPRGARVTVGVDLGVSLSKTADLTALVDVYAHSSGVKQLLNVEAGRWPIDTIASKIVSHHQRYGRAQVVVESVAAQQFVVDLMRRTANVPCIGFKTGGGKMSLQFQAELLAAELARGEWAIPSGTDGKTFTPDVRALVNDLLAYAPGDHCGDRLAALLMARWGCDRGGVIETGRLDLLAR